MCQAPGLLSAEVERVAISHKPRTNNRDFNPKSITVRSQFTHTISIHNISLDMNSNS